jgi:ligand-binding SRPBCC domain-containing protein
MRELHYIQDLPIGLEQAWDFFSSPANLNEITPPEMHFEILGQLPARMYEGMFIRYKIRPMLSIPLEWVTEITKVEDRAFFVDEQRKGPYNIWHHEHHFKAIPGGVRMTDKLYYDVGFGPLGTLLGKLWVDAQVDKIFAYRKVVLEQRFGKL